MNTAEFLVSLVERAGIGVAVFDANASFHYVNARMAAINGMPAEDHVGRQVEDVLPELSATVRALIRQAIEVADPILSVDVVGRTPASDAPRHWEASYVPVQLDGEDAVGVILVDVTERHDAVAETRRRLRQQAALADLGRQALGTAPLDDVMSAATAMLARELGAERSGVIAFAPTRDHLLMRAGTGFPPDAVGTMTAELGPGSQAGFTLQSDGPVVIHDALGERRFRFTPSLLALGVRSSISVPIPAGDEPYGVLGVLASRPGHFDGDDVALVSATAAVLGAAVVRVRQAAQLEELAAQRGRLVAQAIDAGDRERRQVADALHDEVLQHLLFARLELASASAAADDEARGRVLSSIEEATRVLRAVIGGLHPVTLAHAGLAAALEGLANDHVRRSGARADVAVHAGAEGRQDRLVLSLARELLANVAKHAAAKQVRVDVRLDEGALVLDVADDGRGLPADAIDAALVRGNVGLATVRERATAVGGSIALGAGIGGRGARVAVRLPVS